MNRNQYKNAKGYKESLYQKKKKKSYDTISVMGGCWYVSSLSVYSRFNLRFRLAFKMLERLAQSTRVLNGAREQLKGLATLFF